MMSPSMIFNECSCPSSASPEADPGQTQFPAPLMAGEEIQPKGKGELSSDRVQNPHDPEAPYAVKGHASWAGRRVRERQPGACLAHTGWRTQSEAGVERRFSCKVALNSLPRSGRIQACRKSMFLHIDGAI
jgi:hypothetical protein